MESRFKTMIQHFFKSLALGLFVNIAPPVWATEIVSADFPQILNTKAEILRIWQLDSNQNVYIFDFPSLSYQGRTFNRVTQFTEQQTSEAYPKVLSNQELDRHIEAARRTTADFAYGHDVLVSELVQFYNFSIRDKIQLNPEEITLRDFLIEQGFIRLWRGFYQAMRPDVVILAVPQIQDRKPNEPMVSIGARHAILLHELAHGEYYSNIHYTKFCQRFWYDSLNENQRELFKKFLENFNYSVNNEDLLINEMQAYLMFTPDPKSFSARKLGVSDDELKMIRETFRRANPPTRLPLYSTGGM